MADNAKKNGSVLFWAIGFAALVASGATAAADPDPAGGKAARPGTADAAVASLPDMRLWSFGDCDNRFPYVDSAAHKECVRVVGSPEAKDARAYRFCATSYAADPAEVARCKAAYDANKTRLTHSGTSASPGSPEPEQVSPEMMRKVKAITSAAVEHDRAAAQAQIAQGGIPDEPEPVAPPDPEGFWSPATFLLFGFVFMLGLAVAAMMARRKQTGSFLGS